MWLVSLVPQSSGTYIQLSYPEACELLKPRPFEKGTGWAIFYASEGTLTLEFECDRKQILVRAKVGNQDYYGSFNPTTDTMLDLTRSQ